MKEAFLAVDVSLETVERLVLVQEDLAGLIKARGGKVRWVEPARMHLQLKSLGWIDPALLFDVSEVVGRLAGALVPFKVSVKGLVAYPSPRQPRLLLAKIEQGADLVGQLHKVLEKHLGAMGIESSEARPYEAVIQVGRVLTPKGTVDLSDAMEEVKGLDFGESYVKDVMLLVSSLQGSPQAVVHKRFALG